MKIVDLKVADLTAYAKNAKRHPQEQVDNVAESIRQFGMVQPIVVDKDNVVVIGHCRLLACSELGMDTVPCVRVDDLTDEQVKKLRLIDNKTNESPWDFAMLELDMEGLDFEGFDLDFNLAKIMSEDEMRQFFEDAPTEPPKEKEPKTIRCPHCGEYITIE